MIELQFIVSCLLALLLKLLWQNGDFESRVRRKYIDKPKRCCQREFSTIHNIEVPQAIEVKLIKVQ